MLHASRLALEYLHIGLVVFFFAGFLLPTRWTLVFYGHRIFVITDWAVHRITGTCPLTDLTKYLHKLEDPDYVPGAKGCVQQAFDKMGIEVHEWHITLVTTTLTLVCVYQLVRRQIVRRREKQALSDFIRSDSDALPT